MLGVHEPRALSDTMYMGATQIIAGDLLIREPKATPMDEHPGGVLRFTVSTMIEAASYLRVANGWKRRPIYGFDELVASESKRRDETRNISRLVYVMGCDRFIRITRGEGQLQDRVYDAFRQCGIDKKERNLWAMPGSLGFAARRRLRSKRSEDEGEPDDIPATLPHTIVADRS